MSWVCYSERCSVGLGGLDQLIGFCGSHVERVLASVRVLFTLCGHFVLTKNALTAHVKHKQHHLSWLHSCNPSSHFCRPLSHPLRSRGRCVRLTASRRVETEKVTAWHACVSAWQQQHECETSHISALSQDGAKKTLKTANQAEHTSMHIYTCTCTYTHAYTPVHGCIHTRLCVPTCKCAL